MSENRDLLERLLENAVGFQEEAERLMVSDPDRYEYHRGTRDGYRMTAAGILGEIAVIDGRVKLNNEMFTAIFTR